MKKAISIFVIVFLSYSVFSQNQPKQERDPDQINTLFGSHSFSNGGYGSFGAGYTMIDNQNALVASGRAAWIVGHSLGIGFAGTGFINEAHFNPVIDDDVNLTGGYGGILIEPILFPKAPVHLAFPVVAGIGGIAYTVMTYTGDPWEYGTSYVEDTETFFVLEPGVEMEMNVLKFFRLAFGVGYRMTSNIELYDTPSDALNGITAGLTFKFGKF
jgi:hypothetical protein